MLQPPRKVRDLFHSSSTLQGLVALSKLLLFQPCTKENKYVPIQKQLVSRSVWSYRMLHTNIHMQSQGAALKDHLCMCEKTVMGKCT